MPTAGAMLQEAIRVLRFDIAPSAPPLSCSPQPIVGSTAGDGAIIATRSLNFVHWLRFTLVASAPLSPTKVGL
jgi:hypothetical protein